AIGRDVFVNLAEHGAVLVAEKSTDGKGIDLGFEEPRREAVAESVKTELVAPLPGLLGSELLPGLAEKLFLRLEDRPALNRLLLGERCCELPDRLRVNVVALGLHRPAAELVLKPAEAAVDGARGPGLALPVTEQPAGGIQVSQPPDNRQCPVG